MRGYGSCRAARSRPWRLEGSLPLRQRIHFGRIQLDLARGGADFVPGVLVHRDAVALPLLAVLAFRLARHANPVVAGRDAALAQPVEELAALARESVRGAERLRIDDDR